MARIVLIDDEEALRGMFAEVLAGEGHQIVATATGAAGIEAVRREHPDLVLCDVNMPGLDGYAVLAAIRSDAQLSTTPFLFLTGLGDKRQVRTGMTSGADDYLTKPIRPEELIAAVDARLRRHAADRRQADRRVDEMRRSVAVLLPHELRTPLTAILGCSRMLQEFHREMPPEQIEEMAASIVKAAQRLHRMAENYILYADLELQRLVKGELSSRPLHGQSGADDVREAAGERAKEQARESDLRLDADDTQVPVAPPYFRKIVSEVVDNAFKFSEPGKPVSVSLKASGPAVVLEVADSGRGMTPDQIREVAAFRQFDRALFEQQGSGLGLALVRALIEASGGRLEITSRPDEGTRARASWPV